MQAVQVVFTLVSIIFSIGMIFINLLKVRRNVFQKEKAKNVFKWYNIYFGVATIWLLGELILSAASIKVEWFVHGRGNNLIYLFVLYKYVAIFLITPLFALYILSYSSKTLGISKSLLLSFIIPLFLVFVSASIVFITNPGQKVALYNNVSIKTGALFQILMLILYFFLLLVLLLVTMFMLKKFSCYKKQIIIIVLLLFICYVITCTNFQLGLNRNFLRLDIAPVFFLPPVLLMNFYALKYTLLSLIPVAFPRMTDDLREAILIVDTIGNIAYFNQSFTNMFIQCPGVNLDTNIIIFSDYLKNSVDLDSDSDKLINSIRYGIQEAVMGEIRMKDIERTFSVNIKPLELKNLFTGWVVTFIEITEYKNLLNEVKRNNDQLNELNEQLEDYVSKVGELAAVKERNKLTSEVHDSIGHTMTVLISLIGVSSILCDKDIGEVKQKLGQMMEIAIRGHEDLRHSVLGIPKRIEEQGIVKKLRALVKEFEKTGVKVDLIVDGIELMDNVKYGNLIYRVCQEALTNSLKHGKADQVNIILRFSGKKLTLFIIDDGIGINEIKKGLGLSGMEKRVKEVNGLISYGSDGEKGFSIRIEIPVTNA
ncbi:MAG: ATP-binding protein [Bacillota bacterium]|nr:ATP-binding protein [Bacillota bacterium]